ncbi:hypothetical protein HPB48_012150 [Haemaphysalis longicornis]|uniref:Uncharacterized protein n=1 Tax=Haemaphysalis longicornis TaxID=44386 RepID=A0A9J6FC79_HAELO|nr:hypothetical protein HPB48_012150 [Haemaphysalis longicornis]
MRAELGHLALVDNQDLANSVLRYRFMGWQRGLIYQSPTSSQSVALVTNWQETSVHMIKKVGEVDFRVMRLVTDNHKANTAAKDTLCQRKATPPMLDPAGNAGKIFRAFDQSHITKNVRSQFLSRDIGSDKQILPACPKLLYKIQQGSAAKLVWFLSRKHLDPSNIEKMAAKPAMQLFSPPITAALLYMQRQAGHTWGTEFASVGPTVEFRQTMHKWFIFKDVGHTCQPIRRTTQAPASSPVQTIRSWSGFSSLITSIH